MLSKVIRKINEDVEITFGYFDDKMCWWKSFSSKIFLTKLFWLRDSDTPENNSVTYKTWDNNKPFFLSLLNKLIIKKYISSSHKNYRIIPILVTKGRHCTFAHLKYVQLSKAAETLHSALDFLPFDDWNL